MSDIPDVDIDLADREQVVELFADRVVPASLLMKNTLVRHNNGIYFQKIPRSPLNGLAVFPYQKAEELGYWKMDLLGNNVYEQIGSMNELRRLIAEPIDWKWFTDPAFVRTLFHFGNIVNSTLTVAQMVANYAPHSMSDLACLLAIKNPGKKHLIGQPWKTIHEQIWLREPPERGMQFRKSHAVAYAHVVGIDARLKAPGFFDTSGSILLESGSRSAFCERDEDNVPPD